MYNEEEMETFLSSLEAHFYPFFRIHLSVRSAHAWALDSGQAPENPAPHEPFPLTLTWGRYLERL